MCFNMDSLAAALKMFSKLVRHYQQGVALARFQGARKEFVNAGQSSFWTQYGTKWESMDMKQQQLLPKAWVRYVDESKALSKIRSRILSHRNFSGPEFAGHEYTAIRTPARFMFGASNKVQIFTAFSLVSQQLINMSMKSLTDANSNKAESSRMNFFVPGSFTVFQGFASVFKDEDTKLDNVLHKLITSVVVPSIMNSPFATWIYFMFYYRMKMVMSIKGELPWENEKQANVSANEDICFFQDLLVA